MAILTSRTDRPIEPTFYLGGQPYVFEADELVKAGPEFVTMAFYETWRQLWQVFSDFHAGIICPNTFEQQATDLYFGAYQLRDLIPSKERLIPNGHFTAVH